MKNFLTEDERSTLKIQHRSEKDRRTGDRIKAILLADKGWTFKHIAEALFLDEETISLHVSDYNSNKKLSIETGGSQSKLNGDQIIKLSLHLELVTYLRASEICAHVQEYYNIHYTISGMTSWLKNNCFSYKKPKGTPAKADPLEQEIFIATYRELLRTTSLSEPILFADSVHPTMATKITYGWIKKGTDKPISTIGSKTRINIIGAIDLETMKLTTDSYDTINSDSMMQYFVKLRGDYILAPKIHLILDNGSYNTSAKTKDSAEKYGIVLHYLPPYSPNLNPIERLWKVMNEYTRNNRFFVNAKEFREKIMYFFEKTWPEIGMTMVDRINDNFQRLKSMI